jgi:hypothetical protein
MKVKIISLSLSFLVFFSSCKSAVIYTHSQAMDRYGNEREVAVRFGLPDREITSNGIKQWTYDYGTVSRTSTYTPSQTGTATATYNNYLNQVNVTAQVNSSVSSTSTSSYKKYIKFMIDENTKVVKSWNSQGVNLEKIDKKQRLKNILYPSLLVLGAFVAYLIIDENNFQKELNQDDYDNYND